jgi:hypothetical protein
MPARFCPQCGTAVVPKAKFCIECGAPLAGGRVAAERLVPQGPAARVEVGALLAAADAASCSDAPQDADELRLVASFLRRPPPELRAAPLDAAAIGALVDGLPVAA